MFLRSLIPHYGTFRLSDEINALAQHLENLTVSADNGFALQTQELKALRLVSLQNRMALDYLLAEQGGVCTIFGDHCCTYIPDVTNNMTILHDQLEELLAKQKARDRPTSTRLDLWA